MAITSIVNYKVLRQVTFSVSVINSVLKANYFLDIFIIKYCCFFMMENAYQV